MLKKIALGVVGALVLVVGGGGGATASQPDDFKVERSITIDAPPAKAYALVEDFHEWKKWSPFEAQNVAAFTFVPVAQATKVTWAMSGKHSAVTKVMGLFMSMDAMVGKDFEDGMKALKAEAEKKV